MLTNQMKALKNYSGTVTLATRDTTGIVGIRDITDTSGACRHFWCLQTTPPFRHNLVTIWYLLLCMTLNMHHWPSLNQEANQ